MEDRVWELAAPDAPRAQRVREGEGQAPDHVLFMVQRSACNNSVLIQHTMNVFVD